MTQVVEPLDVNTEHGQALVAKWARTLAVIEREIQGGSGGGAGTGPGGGAGTSPGPTAPPPGNPPSKGRAA